MRRRIFGLGLVALAAVIAGCATERPTRSYVQPNYVAKDQYTGEWFMRQTVTDMPGTSYVSFVGMTFEMEKIRWEIQEKWLVAYRSYEKIPGTTREADQANKGTSATRYNPAEAEGRNPGFKEAPIAAYPIEKHFDIFRQYNSTTGEEINVLEENDRDNPWFQRKYMRVDWSANQVVNFNMFTLQNPTTGALTGARGQWYVQDSEGGRDKFRVDYRTTAGKNEAYYFDFVSKIFVDPDLYECILSYYGNPSDGCTATEMNLRTSFLKVDGPRDYEPVQYDDRKMSKFGYFRTERLTYNRNRGVTQTGRIYLANVHNIWNKSLERDAKGNMLYADAEGQQVFYTDALGYHYRDAQGKTVLENGAPKAPSAVRPLYMPKEKRPAKPIVYWLSANYPKEMILGAEQTALSWNKAFRNAVALGQNRNLDDIDNGPGQVKGSSFRTQASCEIAHGAGACTSMGGDAFCKTGSRCDSIQDMFVLAYNGWVKTVAGKEKPFNDYQPVRDADHSDGRAVTFAYDTAMEKFQIGDLRYNTIFWVNQPQMAGPLGYGPSAADPETGEIVSGTAYVYGAAVDTYATMALDSVRLLNNQTSLDQFVSGQTVADYIRTNLDRSDPRARVGTEVRALDLKSAQERVLGARKLAKIEQIKRFGFEPAQHGKAENFMRKVKEGGFESLLMNDEIRIQRSRGGYTPGSPLTSAEMSKIDFASWGTPQALKAKNDRRMKTALRNSLTLAEFADDSVLGLAMEYANRGPGDFVEGGKIWQDLRTAIYRGVMEHEVGHTIGLRHNFQGSFDSMNFHNEYWDLRKENLKHASEVRSSVQKLLDMQAKTQTQVQSKMSEYQYSTVMDYGARFNSDIHGIGKYDMASIAFAYAGAVEVFNVNRQQVDFDTAETIEFTANKPSPIYDALTETVHYTQLPFRFSPSQDKNEGVANMQSRRYVRFDDLQALRAQSQIDNTVNVPLEVPYMFCSDDWIGAIASCQLWDQGADHSEITHDIIDRYRNYYFFNNYKRDRHPFDAYGVLNRVFSRYLSYLPNMYQHWLFSKFYVAWDDGTNGVGDTYWTFSTLDGLNLIAEVLTKPQYGTYGMGRDIDNQPLFQLQSYAIPDPESGEPGIGRGEGRRIYSRYDLDSGYYLFDRTLEAGHFWEYLAGIFAIVQAEATVLGVETASDFTSYSIPYYLIFEEETSRLMNGIFSRDYKNIAPRINSAGRLANYHAVDIYGDNAAPEGTPIDLNINFTQQIYAMLYSMAFFTSSYSLHFPDQAQVFRMGAGEAVTAGDGYRVESFTDPLTGHQYGCFVKQTGTTNTLAAKIVTRGKALAAEHARLRALSPTSTVTNMISDVEYSLNDIVGDINILRPLYETFARTF